MRIRILFFSLLLVGFLLSLLGISQPQAIAAELSRFTQKSEGLANVEYPIVDEAQIAFVDADFSGPGVVKKGKDMQVARAYHTVTQLMDGRILLVGGSKNPTDYLVDVEIFNPRKNRFVSVAPLHTARHGHTATLLHDGRVLVIGGFNPSQMWLGDAEVYNPVANTWTVVPPLYSHGVEHTATVLKDGRVLVVGGCIGSGICTERVEIFHPKTNTWTEATPLLAIRASHTANLLKNGLVLIAGGGTGTDGDALLYNPRTNTWKTTEPMVQPRTQARAVRLADGRVLVAGGITPEDQVLPRMTASVEIYNPASNTWTAAAELAKPRYGFSLVMLTNGRVLAIDGACEYNSIWTENSFVKEIEIYDPRADRWQTVGQMPIAGAYAAATVLPSGWVWVTGGQEGKEDSAYLRDTWLISPHFSKPPMPTPTTANDDLLVWYNFEDNFLSLGKVPDSSGHAYDALVNGEVNTTEGISGGQAISFSGNGYILAQNNPAAGRNAVSFSLWFKTEHPEENYKLASAAWWNGGPGSGWILATHIPEFWSEDTQSLYLPDLPNNDNQFSAGEWIHEVVTYDGAYIKEYTNGQLINNWPTTGAALGQGNPMAVGAWPPFSGFNFVGAIDEFKIFSRALTEQEVQELYAQR